MLRKLLKHELRAGAPAVLLLAAGVLAVSGLTRLLMLFSEFFEFFAMLSMLTTVFYVIGIIAAHVFVYVLIIRRFYTSVYGGEGYVTLMLPVQRWKVILSKLLVSLLWLLISGLATVLSLMVVASYPEVYREAGYMLSYLAEAVGWLMRLLRMPAALLIAEGVLVCILSVVQGILMLYASVSIGQLFRRHRLLGSAAGYMILYAAIQLLMSGYMLVAGLTLDGIGSGMNLYRQTLDGMSVFQLHVLAVVYVLLLALITAVYWIITHTIMKKAVNLQ